MRSHARGPFSANSNLRVQKVLILTPNGASQSFLISAAANDPALLKIQANVDTAVPTGTNALTVGTPGNATAFMAGGDSSPGSTGLATEKKFVIVADTTLVAVLTSIAIAGAGALTITAITGANTQTVTIDGHVYTYNTSLTNTADNVLIGASATTMAANLASAINAGAGSGTTYGAGTVAHTTVTATSALGVLTVTAKTPGSAGNSIATTETLTNGSWGAVTLAAGADASTTGQMTLFIDA